MRTRAAALAALVLTACAVTGNVPTTLQAVPPPAEPGAIADRPAYAAIDKYSFSNAVVLYWAYKGDHRIPVGDYLVGRLALMLEGPGWELVRLRKLDARCLKGDQFSPRAMCNATLEVELRQDGKARTVSGTVEKLDVGPVYVPRQQLLMNTAQFSDAPILGEARTLIDAVLAKIQSELQQH